MKKILFILSMILVLFATGLQAQTSRANTPVPYTLADRDRLLKVENKLELLDDRITSLEKRMDDRITSLEKRMDERLAAMQKTMDERFAAQDKRLDDLFTLMILLLGSMFVLFGFILWDRKSVVRPVRDTQEKILTVLREQAKDNKFLTDIMNKAGLL